MSSWVYRQASFSQTQLAATAVFSGLVVAGTILSVQAIRRQLAIEDLKASIPKIDEKHSTDAVCLPNKLYIQNMLMIPVKLPDYGAALGNPLTSKEEERIATLARRAQQGDYDEGDDRNIKRIS